MTEDSFVEPAVEVASTPREKATTNTDADEFDFDAFKKLADE